MKEVKVDSERRAVLAIYPDGEAASGIAKLISSHPEWAVHQVSGAAAMRCLEVGETLRHADARQITETSVQLRRELWNLLPYRGSSDVPDRLQVLAPNLVPVDLALHDQDDSIGDATIVSHVMTRSESITPELLQRTLAPARQRLSSYVLLCPMALDRQLERHMQDIVVVASSLEDKLPVEVWLQPTLHRPRQAVQSPDVGILHIDTHGDYNGGRMMLGPSREGGSLIASTELPEPVGAALVVAVGCSLTASAEGVGMGLLKRGAITVLGPCIQFHSLEMTGSEEGEANWYRAIYKALIAGADIGVALRRARTTIGDHPLKNTWILLGSSLLSFGPQSV